MFYCFYRRIRVRNFSRGSVLLSPDVWRKGRFARDIYLLFFFFFFKDRYCHHKRNALDSCTVCVSVFVYRRVLAHRGTGWIPVGTAQFRSPPRKVKGEWPSSNSSPCFILPARKRVYMYPLRRFGITESFVFLRWFLQIFNARYVILYAYDC